MSSPAWRLRVVRFMDYELVYPSLQFLSIGVLIAPSQEPKRGQETGQGQLEVSRKCPEVLECRA